MLPLLHLALCDVCTLVDVNRIGLKGQRPTNDPPSHPRKTSHEHAKCENTAKDTVDEDTTF